MDKAIITCAVTGNAPFNPSHPAFPVSPKEIADACEEAAKAGAAIVHVHVRDETTKLGIHDPALFKEVVDRVRDRNVDVLINLTGGNGAFYYPDPKDEARGLDQSNMMTPEQRIEHLELCRPDIASIDITTGNQEEGDEEFVYLNTPRTLKSMFKAYNELSIKPEVEVFEAGDLMFAHQLISDGFITGDPMIQFVLGVKWAAPSDAETVLYLKNKLPQNSVWTAMGIGRHQMPMAALSIAQGGHIRVGLEDNLYLKRGVFATNGQLVDRAAQMAEIMGREVASASDARQMLGITGS